MTEIREDTQDKPVLRWRRVIAEQQRRLNEARKALSTTEAELRRVAAEAAGGDEPARRRLDKAESNRRKAKTLCGKLEAALSGAQERLDETETRAQAQGRAAAWKRCAEIAAQRESLAGELERHLMAAARTYEDLDRLGLELHRRAPCRAAWLGRGGVISGGGLLERVKASFRKAGFPWDRNPMQTLESLQHLPPLAVRERELHDVYLKQARK